MAPASEEEAAQTAEILQKLTPGFLPLPLFKEFTRLVPSRIVELVPLRKSNGQTEVLLFQRPDDDPYWPGQLHSPGTVVRATDVSLDGSYTRSLQRLYEQELGFQPTLQPTYITEVLHKVNRGVEAANVMSIDLTNVETPTGTWYPTNNLPGNLVDTQRGLISDAVNAFEEEGR